MMKYQNNILFGSGNYFKNTFQNFWNIQKKILTLCPQKKLK